MVIAPVPILVAIVGLVIYLVTAQPKASELGRLLFFAGILVALFAVAGHVAKVP